MTVQEKRLVVLGNEDGWWDESDTDCGVWHCNQCPQTLKFSPHSRREDIELAVRAHIERYCEEAR